MSKHEKVLDSVFADHVSGNLHWKEIESLLNHLGAEFHEVRGARVVVRLNGRETSLHRPHHGSALSKTELHHIKQFLLEAGIR